MGCARAKYGRLAAAITALLTASLWFGAIAVGPALAEGQLVSAPARNDVAYDDARGLLYITSGDSVLRWDVASRQFLEPFVVGGSLVGMDLSPDGRTLAVADRSYAGDSWGSGFNRFCLVDLDTGTIQSVYNTLEWGEAGTWMVAYGFDGSLLVSSQFSGSGWSPLRRYYPLSGLVTEVASLRQNAALSASGDRTVVGYVEPNISSGAWGTYRFADGLIVPRTGYAAGTSQFNYEVGQSRNGAQTAIPLNGTCAVYSAALGRYDFGNPIGVKYSPTADVVYLPTAGTKQIRAYSTNDFTQIATYTVDSTFGTYRTGLTNASSFAWPRMAVSKDNSLLFCTVSGGVQCIPLRSSVKGTVRSSWRSSPVPGAVAEMYRYVSGSWSVEATRATGASGAFSCVTDNTSAPVRVRVTDPSGMHAPAWVGGDSIFTATEFFPSKEPTPTADVTMTLSSPASIDGAVRSTWQGNPVQGATVTLYQVTSVVATVTSVTTSADGSYHFGGVGKSAFRLGFSDPSGAHVNQFYSGKDSLASATQFNVTSSVTSSRDATMTFLPYRVRGTVLSSFRSVPVAGAQVQVWSDKGAGPTPDTTVTALADGTWSFVTDTSTPLWFRVIDPSGVSDPQWADSGLVGDGVVPTRQGDIPGVGVVMSLTHPGSIGGIVRSSSHTQPVGGLTVTLYQDIAGYPTIATTVTAEDGSYHFPGLGVTKYRLGFSDGSGAHDPSFYPNSSTLAAAGSVSVTGPEETSVNMSVPFVWYRVGGVVRSSFLNLVVPNAEVSVWRKAGAVWVYDGLTQADASGHWVYSVDSSSPVRLYVADPSGIAGPAWYGGASLDAAQDVTPLLRVPAEFTATLPLTHPAVVTGVVRSSYLSHPVSGVNVYLLYSDDGIARRFASTTTAEDGSYSFANVGRVSGYLGFEDPTGAHVEQWGAQTFTIGSPTTLTFETTLTALPGSVSGVVKSSFDSPDTEVTNPGVKHAVVEVWRQSSGEWSRATTLSAGADGAWTYSNLDYSPVKLRFSDPAGMHDSAWYGGATLASATPVALGRSGGESRDAILNLSHPATITGTVRDSLTGARMGDVDVLLCQTGPGWPMVDLAVTGKDGVYRIGGIPPGDYYLVFGESLDNYYTQFWKGAHDWEAATPLSVSAAGTVTADAQLAPIVSELEFGEIDSAAQVTSPRLGAPIHLSADLADQWGDPFVGAAVYVQSSADGFTWATQPSVSVTSRVEGTYEATLTPPPGTTHYRFAFPGTEFASAAYSAPIVVQPRTSSLFFSGTAILGPNGATPFPGERIGISATVMGETGTVVTTATVELQSSPDGVRWWSSTGVSATGDGFGTHTAMFGAGASAAWYRLAWMSAPGGAIYSPILKIVPGQHSGAWVRAGVGSAAARMYRGRTPSHETCVGTLRIPESQLDSTAWVYLESSTDGSTWVTKGLPQRAKTQSLESTYSAVVTCSRTTRLRWTYRASDWSAAFASDTFWISPYASMGSRPELSTRVPRAKRAFWVKGTVTAHRLMDKTVRVTLQKKRGSRWVAVKTCWASNRARNTQTMEYRLKLSLKKGSYRVRAWAPADSEHSVSPCTTWKTFWVR